MYSYDMNCQPLLFESQEIEVVNGVTVSNILAPIKQSRQ